MKSKRIYIIELLLFISIIVFNLFFRNELLLNISIILLTVITYLLFGFYKDNSYVKGNVNRIIIASLLAFFMVTYIIGLFVGFTKTIFQLSPKYLLNTVLLTMIVILCEELLRYIAAKNSFKTKWPIIIFTIIMCVLNIIIGINGYDFTDREMIFIFISVVVITVISREALCSYLAYNVSIVPCIIFKLIIEMYEYVLPIIPRLGNYLFSVFNLILVYIIFYFSNKIITYSEKREKYTRVAARRIIYVPILAVLLVMIVLVSGFLKYKMIAVASGSMVPTYEKGDAVIYEKVNADQLQIGDILAFQKNDIIVTHRIVEIRKNVRRVFITKGDANKSVDSYEVEASNVLGKVVFKVRYIGYPTVWINEFFKRGAIE